MNYTPQEQGVKTSCKDCLFAEYKDKTQYGCSANRISKFEKDDIIEAYDKDKEFFVIKRLCNFYRDQKWNCGIADLDLAKNESAISFDILIDCDGITTDYELSIIESLKSLGYDKNKINIVFFHSTLCNNNEYKIVSNIIKQIDIPTTISVYLHKEEFLNGYVLNRAKHFFHTIVQYKYLSNLGDKLNQINDYINIDMKKCIVYKHTELMFISNHACRFIYNGIYINNSESMNEVIENSKSNNLYMEV